MIAIIYYGLIFISLCLITTAIGIGFNKNIPDQHIRRPLWLLCLATPLFFLEHHHPLGQFHWAWPILTLIAAWRIHHHWQSLKLANVAYSLIFSISFLLFFSWRLIFPDIKPYSGESITDLYFLAHFLDGTQLPAQDLWFAELQFNFYYHFFYYLLGWIGRIYPLSPGETYNLAIALIYALIFSASWGFAKALKLPKLGRLLVASAITLGGTVASPVIPFILKDGWRAFITWDSFMLSVTQVRLIGTNNRALTEGATTLLNSNNASAIPELPLEFASSLWLQGDLHPPLFSFLLLIITAYLVYLLFSQAKPRTNSLASGLLGATCAWVMVSNTWVFPAQAFVFLMCLLVFCYQGRWRELIFSLLGAIIVTGLTSPILEGLMQTQGGTSIRTLDPDIKTPLLAWIFWWPLLLLLILPATILKQRKIDDKWPLIIFSISTLAMVALAWNFYINDPYHGYWARFNTSLKFWSWANLALILTLAMLSKLKFAKWPTYIVLIMCASQVFVVMHFATTQNKSSAFKLAGHHWFTNDASNLHLLNYLINSPKGLVIESFDDEKAYSRSGRFALFSAQPSLLNCPGHQTVWRGSSFRQTQLENKIIHLYQARLSPEETLSFLMDHQVQYLLWTPDDVRRTPHNWPYIQRAIQEEYLWVSFYDVDIHRVGLWVRR